MSLEKERGGTVKNMCCITLDAKIILNNLFGSPCFSENLGGESVDINTINQCSVFISNNLPGFVFCDLSEESICEAVEDGNFDYDFSRKKFRVRHAVNRELYNQFYPQTIAIKLERIVDSFLKRGLYKEQVTPVKTLVG